MHQSLLTKFKVLLLCLLFLPIYLHNLVSSPMGLTVDEAAFAYNATLLSKTAHDENGRFLPVFVLSIDGKDWRQPITQYYQTAFFKLFGASIYNLRLSNLVLVFAIGLLLYYLLSLVINPTAGLLGLFFYLTTPIVFIHGHLALDNNAPLFFLLLYLITLYKYTQTKKLSNLIYAGISLGICFYTYKAMRATVPIWGLTTLLYIFLQNKKLKPLIYFSAGLAPFALAAPILQKLYPGSVFDKNTLHLSSVYDFFYPYISSFDLGFLFIKGDDTPFHSTGIHGMFLLASLPILFYCFYQIIKTRTKNKFLFFILLLLVLTPSLMGLVGSIHRASRLMVFVPFFAIAFASITSKLNFKLRVLIIFAFLLNFIDLFSYYHLNYNLKTQALFGNSSYYHSYITLNSISQKTTFTPYINKDLSVSKDISGKFFQEAYLSKKAVLIQRDEELPKNAVLMTNRAEVPGLNLISCDEFGQCFFQSP